MVETKNFLKEKLYGEKTRIVLFNLAIPLSYPSRVSKALEVIHTRQPKCCESRKELGS